MHELDINGITVKYPFSPYEVQKHYMQSVIRSLENGENAVLESPTGTGKTLCLLCSTLGWIEHRKKQLTNADELCINDSISNAKSSSNGKQNNIHTKPNDVPLVIYASRTHSQLLQAMGELKRSAYGYMKAGVVASRDQLCIHPELKMDNNSDKINNCKKLRSDKSCGYYSNVGSSLNKPEFSENSVLDIEDLRRHGKNFECCPYYVAQHLTTNADILFMPYNYLLDPKIREIQQINLRNAIVILDEAHNVPKVCEDSACSRITSTEIFIALRDIKFILKSLPNAKSMERKCSIGEVTRLRHEVLKLNNEILNIKVKDKIHEDSYPGGYIFELFKKAGMNKDTIETLQKLMAYLVEYSRGVAKCPKGIGLQAVLDFLQTSYSSSAPDLRERVNRAYKVYIQYEPEKKKNENENKRKRSKKSNAKEDGEEDVKNRKIINFWCFSAEFGMNYLQQQNIHCVILTSGTLTPLDSLINELQIPIPIELSNKHVINKHQVYGRIVEIGPDNQLLDSCYLNRDTEEYMLSLGKTILEFSKVVPEGLLVFFAAYSVMDNCIQFWERDGIYNAIDNEKKIFIEPRKKTELKKAMNDYYAKINEENSRGAIFMAVLRAKVSEGLDFADMYGRAVIVTGLPFGPYKDPKIILKRKYLDENRTKENRMLSGWEWYVLDAVRAVNQAIGRVIRHKNDYGAIFLCDKRFSRNQKNISSWIKNELHSNQPLDKIINELERFYENSKRSLPEPTRTVPQVDSSDDDDEDQTDTFVIKYESSYDYTSSESDDDNNEEEIKSRSTSPIPSTSAAGQMNNGSRVTIHKKKLRLSDPNESEVVNEPAKAHPIPKYMENQLGIERYQQLVQIWFNYDADGNYELYRDSLFNIFDDKKAKYFLKGCLLFTKSEHEVSLGEDIDKFIEVS